MEDDVPAESRDEPATEPAAGSLVPHAQDPSDPPEIPAEWHVPADPPRVVVAVSTLTDGPPACIPARAPTGRPLPSETPPELSIAPDPTAESYVITPSDPGEEVERRQHRLRLAALAGELPPDEPQATNERQFTIRQMVLLTVAAALALGLVRALDQQKTAQSIAALSGLLATLGMLGFLFFRPWFLVRAVWWALVAVYVIAGAMATMLS